MKSEIEMIREGSLMASYGSKFFVTFGSALGIGKFKCSVVKLGTQGNDSYDIYLTTGEIKRFVDDILKGIAFKKISEEKSKYPSTYAFTKGENGSNILNIGKSTIDGCVGVQAGLVTYNGDKKDSNFRLSPVSENDIRDFALRFYVCVCGLLPTATGFTPLPENSYYSKMNKAFWDGEKERETIFSGKETQEAEEQKSKLDSSTTDSSAKKKENPASKNNKPTGKTSVPSIHVHSTSIIQKEGEDYVFSAAKENGEVITIVMKPEAVNNLEKKTFDSFVNKINDDGADFSFTGSKHKLENGNVVYYFSNFA